MKIAASCLSLLSIVSCSIAAAADGGEGGGVRGEAVVTVDESDRNLKKKMSMKMKDDDDKKKKKKKKKKDDFVLEGDRMYIGCDAYVFHMSIKCGVFGEKDPDLCIMKSVIVGQALEDLDGNAFVGDVPFVTNSLYGMDIDDIDPNEKCIGSGVFPKSRIKGKSMKPIPMISSDGCGELKPDDYSFVLKGNLATDGSNEIQLHFSDDFGFTYYTKSFGKQDGIYRAYPVDTTAVPVNGRRLKGVNFSNIPKCLDKSWLSAK